MEAKKRDVFDILGIALMVFGGGVWCVYAAMRWGLSLDVTARQYLPYHLAGVVPGVILKRRALLSKMISKLLS